MFQNWPFKSYQLPFDHGVQKVIPPRSPASVPEPIGTPFDVILHQSKWPGFVGYYVNGDYYAVLALAMVPWVPGTHQRE